METVFSKGLQLTVREIKVNEKAIFSSPRAGQIPAHQKSFRPGKSGFQDIFDQIRQRTDFGQKPDVLFPLPESIGFDCL
jgi:hypothetical protein